MKYSDLGIHRYSTSSIFITPPMFCVCSVVHTHKNRVFSVESLGRKFAKLKERDKALARLLIAKLAQATS